MKSPGAIRQKLKQVRWRYLKQRIETELRATSCNCTHNLSVSAVPGQFAICMYGAQSDPAWVPTVCDQTYDKGARARECPYFKNRRNKEEIKAAFNEELSTMDISEIAAEYPDMAALIWVMGPEDVTEGDEPSNANTVEEETASPLAPTPVLVEHTPPLVQHPPLTPPPVAPDPPTQTDAPRKSWWQRLIEPAI